MTLWLIFAILGPMLWGFSNSMDSAVRRHFVKNDLAATWFLSISRVPFLIVIFSIIGFKFFDLKLMLLMFAAGFLWLYPFILYYKAIEYEEPTRLALLMQTTIPILAAVTAFFMLKETLVPYQLLAFIMILIGGCFAATIKLSGIWRVSKAAGIIVLASFLWAFSDVLFKKITPAFPDFWHAFAFYLLGGLFFAIIMMIIPSKRRIIVGNLKDLPNRAWRLIIINLVVGLSGSLAFAYALTLGKASLTAVLTGTQPLFAFIASMILSRFIPEIYKEDTSKRSLVLKGASFVLILIGLVFLQMYNT